MNPTKRIPTTQISPKAIKIAFGVALIVLILIVAAAAYIWFSGGSGQPSAAITASSLERKPNDTRTLFRLDANQSEVRFLIDEVLLGSPTTVVGITNELAGEMLIDFDEPANSEIGAIQINVRTLKTDNEFRNRAIRGQIFEANLPEYEFAEFVVTDLIGMPDQITVGNPVAIQIRGQLRVHGVAKDVTFDTTLELSDAMTLAGSAQASVHYADFGMRIPEAPGVANVADEVLLEFNFIAEAAME